MGQVNPEDLPLGLTLQRLLGLCRAEARYVVPAICTAMAAAGLALAIPVVVQRAIDHAIVPRRPSALWPYLAVLLALAVARLVVNGARRFATGRAALGVERRVRARLFETYLTLPRAFYDRHATGQVISRATNDLFAIQQFVGWGVVQTLQSGVMLRRSPRHQDRRGGSRRGHVARSGSRSPAA